MNEAKLIKIFLNCFFVGVVALAIATLRAYPGHAYSYLLFTLTGNLLLYFGFREKHYFFDTFIGILLWLGFWCKFSQHMTFMAGKYAEATGAFDFSPEAYDYALNVSSCGLAALIFAFWLRGKLAIPYLKNQKKNEFASLKLIYIRHRKELWICFAALVLFFVGTNIYFGFYQRGCVPKTTLPFGLAGIYTWLFSFGFSGLAAVLLNFELELNANPILPLALSIGEIFLSNVSTLSRGMILNGSSLFFGIDAKVKKQKLGMVFLFKIKSIVFAVLLFVSSIFIVNFIRAERFGPELHHASTIEYTQSLFVDRFVGIEGIMAVTSSPLRGWDLWREAMQERVSASGTSLFDKKIITSPYSDDQVETNHFVSLPGTIALLFYPGSVAFLFFAMCIVGAIGSVLEFLAFRFGGGNFIFTALIAQVVASRFANFGYAPAQSYVLFVSLILNIFIFWTANYWFGKTIKSP